MRYLGVPLIVQEKSMSCWHASARMIWAYKFRQCIHPLSSVYEANTGVTPAQFVQLARTLGLESVPTINVSYAWNGVAELLRLHGPLWVAGYWYGVPHIVVVTGVDPDGTLYINDPAGAERVHDIEFFNKKIASDVSNPIMFLPFSRANSVGYATYFE